MLTPNSDSILVRRSDSVTTVTLNRPGKLNALDLATWRRLAEVMGELGEDDSLRCVVLTGAGNAFAAGADISKFASERDTIEKARVYGEAEHSAVMAVAVTVVLAVMPAESWWQALVALVAGTGTGLLVVFLGKAYTASRAQRDGNPPPGSLS